MKKASLSLLIICALCGCNKIDIETADLFGTWVEEYSDYPYYAPEGGAYWTFGEDGQVLIHYYDVFAGDSYETKSYLIGGESGDTYIYLNFYMSDFSGADYKIVKFSKNEMEWQRSGTTFSKGTVGSDFKHFVRSSDK